MRNRVVHQVCLYALAVTLVACSAGTKVGNTELTGVPSTGPIVNPSTTTTSPATATSPNPTITAISTATASDLAPLSFEDFLTANIDAGKWTVEQGLIATLKVFAGESTLADVYGSSVIEQSEGTGIIERARQYLESSSDTNAKNEINRLLDIISPSPEYLKNNSTLVSKHQSSFVVLVGLKQQTTCFNQDTPPPNPGTRFPCYEYTNEMIDGQQYRIYLPTNWNNRQGTREELNKVTREALRTAVTTYNQLGLKFSADVVFSHVESLDGPRVFADTRNRTPCSVVVRPHGVRLENVSLHSFQQAIAHELFHCFQYINFPNQMQIPRRNRSWWVEGSAQFFSNLAYPDANFEYGVERSGRPLRLEQFDRSSLNQPIYQLSYENAFFFQHLANTRNVGVKGILRMLQTMPIQDGLERQRDTLAIFPDIRNIFHQFGQTYLDRAIQDTDGGNHISIQPTMEQINIGGTSGQELVARPFVLKRYAITFAANKRYRITTSVAGEPGNSSVKPIHSLGQVNISWQSLPNVVDTCNSSSQQYAVLLTTTTSSSQGSILTINSTGDECVVPASNSEDALLTTPSPNIDPCFVGSWTLTSSKAFGNMYTPESGLGAVITFHKSGDFTINFSGAKPMRAAVPPLYDLTITTQGQIEGSWAGGGSVVTLYNFRNNATYRLSGTLRVFNASNAPYLYPFDITTPIGKEPVVDSDIPYVVSWLKAATLHPFGYTDTANDTSLISTCTSTNLVILPGVVTGTQGSFSR